MSILPEQPETLMAENTSRKLTDPTVLVATANRMVNKVLVEPDPEHRTREMIARWHVANLLSAVDESTWFNMVSAALDGQKKTLNNMQSNGNWQPCAFESEIRDVEGSAVLMLGVKWTDENGGDEVQYQNGAPIVNVNVTAKTEPSGDSAMTLEILKMLAAGQVNANEAIARLEGVITSDDKVEASVVNVDLKSEEDVVIKEAEAKKSNPRTAGKRSMKRRPAN